MKCPQCLNEMVKAQATAFGQVYDYCRTCKKELAEMTVPKPDPVDETPDELPPILRYFTLPPLVANGVASGAPNLVPPVPTPLAQSPQVFTVSFHGQPCAAPIHNFNPNDARCTCGGYTFNYQTCQWEPTKAVPPPWGGKHP